jgi:hypothetical protein
MALAVVLCTVVLNASMLPAKSFLYCVRVSVYAFADCRKAKYSLNDSSRSAYAVTSSFSSSQILSRSSWCRKSASVFRTRSSSSYAATYASNNTRPRSICLLSISTSSASVFACSFGL